MNDELQILLETIKEDYLSWSTLGTDYDSLADHRKNMIEEFNNGLTINVGSKYIKVISNNSVWGFVVNTENDKKFKNGDILKAAGWNAPARNAARGNIFEGGYKIQWTGPLYLK